MLQIPELLAPAGDAERLRYAINYGADAVYCGLPEFGMRSAPANFTPEQLTESVIYAHARGRKVYLTMNTLPTNEEADRLPEAIKNAAAAGVDAFIVADLGVMEACKQFAPDIFPPLQHGLEQLCRSTDRYDPKDPFGQNLRSAKGG